MEVFQGILTNPHSVNITMNHLLIQNEIERVEQALAARLNKSKVSIFAINMMDNSKWSPLEFKTLNRFIVLANSVNTTESAPAEVVNEIVATSNLLVALFEALSKTGSKFGRAPAAAFPGNARDLDLYDDEYALGRAGIRTGSAENFIGRHLRDD